MSLANPDTLACRPKHTRRGALLLLVLSMLTLFMMIGTLLLVLAIRARSTARAFADSVAGAGNRSALGRSLLDEALMTLVRGSPPAQPGNPLSGPTRESLLADRYGPNTLQGQLTGIAVNGPVVRATVSGINPPTALDLAGRILTIQPQPSDPAPITSFRILAVSGTAFELANLRTVGVRPLPTVFPCSVFINGREFAGPTENESWDGYDSANLFLTQASAQIGGVTVQRPAYAAAAAGAAAPLEVDNDGDGIADGSWIEDLLPEPADGSTARVSLLVLDLGGRLNVNAHGSLAGVPGSGPATVDGASLFLDQAVWNNLLAGGSSPSTPQPLKPGLRRVPPAIGGSLQGRFGGGPTDTYGLRLDFDGPRPGNRTAPFGNVFTCGELEWVLRVYDDDTTALPPRLAAILGDSAEGARMLITTDSWDTCGMTGATARSVASNGDPIALPAETKEGLRLNLDRPLDDDSSKQQLFRDLLAVVKVVGAGAGDKAAQWCANVVDFIDTDSDVGEYEAADGGMATGVEPPADGKLGTWNAGRLESIGELLGIPSVNQATLDDALRDGTPLLSLAAEHPEILDAVTVASPFRSTVFVQSGGRTLCRWREPGRINVNTCDDRAWKALIGANHSNPFQGGATVARTAADLLLGVPQVLSGADKDVRSLDRKLANRLANIATTRSDVFAVWITLELTAPDDGAEPINHRLFAIIDRSVPVGFAVGRDLNARDAIRVLRYLE